MKLLIQHNHYKDEISGVLTYISSIQSELNLRGIETKVISTTENSSLQWIDYIAWADLIHMNSNHLAFACLCKIFNKKIVIKYHYLFYTSIHSRYQSMSLFQRLKTEFVHSLPKSNYPLKWKLHTIVKLAKLATRFLTALIVDRHTACSQFLADSHSFPWKVTTLYNPIQVQDHPLQKTVDDLSKPDSFVYVGRLNPDKGVDLLLKATKLIQTQDRDFRVLIIGDGGEAKALQSLATELDILNRVEFLGNCSQPKILLIVRSALALVAPSRWQEPAGYVVLEASSVSTCSIVANVGGLPEMAGSHTFLFEQENVEELAAAMKFCLDHPQEAIDRGKGANQYVSERFSPAQTVDHLLKVYQEISPNFNVQNEGME